MAEIGPPSKGNATAGAPKCRASAPATASQRASGPLVVVHSAAEIARSASTARSRPWLVRRHSR